MERRREKLSSLQNSLNSLEQSQRSKAVLDFKDATQRKRWSNLPTSFVKRGGLRMGDLTKAQRDAVMTLLKTAFSPQGYEKVVQIVEADELLKKGGSSHPILAVMNITFRFWVSLPRRTMDAPVRGTPLGHQHHFCG